MERQDAPPIRMFALAPAPTPIAPTVTLNLSAISVEVNDLVSVSWELDNGDFPDAKVDRATWFVRDEHDVTNAFPADISGNSSSFMPKFGVQGVFVMYITYGIEEKEAYTDTFTITGSDETVEQLKVNLSLDKTSVRAGEPITVTINVSGGEEPYQVADNAIWFYYESSGEGSNRLQAITNMQSTFTPQVA